MQRTRTIDGLNFWVWGFVPWAIGVINIAAWIWNVLFHGGS